MDNYLQSQFNEFHETIKLHEKEDNSELRDKRDMLTTELKDYFNKKSDEIEDFPKITFTIENQGSYSMGTGIKPLSQGDYDIDVMVLFRFSKDDHQPVDVKKWVYESLNKSNRTVDYKKPCVRVQYYKSGMIQFHVDLALYANENDDGKTYLSVGKPTSHSADKKWEVSNPKRLKEKIDDRFSDSDDRQQMKRIIRYLKRWKDFKFKNTENGKPTGIALTALAYNLFQPQVDRNFFDSSITPKDLIALKNFVSAIFDQFSLTDTISVKLPVEPYNNLFEKMSEYQQKLLKEELKSLKSALRDAVNEPDPHEASKILRKHFGEDFPEVEKSESAQKRPLAFPGKSESA